MKILSHSHHHTEELARELAARLGPRDCVLLHGDLGAGKSVMARALVRALCGAPDLAVPSPTFTLVQHYDLPGGGALAHFDLYRVQMPDEVFELGWDDARASGLTLVEWPQRLGPHQPARALNIEISQVPGQTEWREIIIDDARRAP